MENTLQHMELWNTTLKSRILLMTSEVRVNKRVGKGNFQTTTFQAANCKHVHRLILHKLITWNTAHPGTFSNVLSVHHHEEVS